MQISADFHFCIVILVAYTSRKMLSLRQAIDVIFQVAGKKFAQVSHQHSADGGIPPAVLLYSARRTGLLVAAIATGSNYKVYF